MSAALFNLDNDGTLEILISRANVKKIMRVTVAEPGRKTAKTFLPDVPPLESEWELNPGMQLRVTPRRYTGFTRQSTRKAIRIGCRCRRHRNRKNKHGKELLQLLLA